MDVSSRHAIQPAAAPDTFLPALRRPRLALYLIVIIAVGLYSAAALQKSYWEDEAFTAAVAQRDPDLLQGAIAADVHPPLYIYLASFWGRIFGYDEAGLRSLSILFSAVAVLLTYALARDLFDERVAVVSAVVIGLAPLMVMFGHNARYYSLSAALAVLAALSTVKFARTGRWRYLASYTFAAVLDLYLVYSSVIVPALCIPWFFILRRAAARRDRAQTAAWLASQLLVGVLYLPGLMALLQLAGRFSDITTPANWPAEILKRLLYSSYVYALGETLSPLHPAAWLGGLIILVAAIAAVWKYRRTSHFWLVVSFCGAILAFNVLVSLNATVSLTWQNLPARNISLVPFLAIWIAAGLAALPRRRYYLSCTLLLAVFLFASWNYFNGRQYLRPIYAVPWRAIFANIGSQANPGAVVICSQGDFACSYYQKRFGYPRFTSHNFSGQPPADEVWWIQTNLTRQNDGGNRRIPEEAMARYRVVELVSYAQQDPGIRRLKSRWMGAEEVEFRVIVYHFKEAISK